eukprot:TRINITY_DN116_c1_g1_i1.p1 TRINITY_DN116_c1_g1~~TRINITY_DN116_c1_g1_i1.p1  ORF type:complete len:415 (+),score=111.82 TRINITY_DN116_c1_g1_i1:117-1247(+)
MQLPGSLHRTRGPRRPLPAGLTGPKPTSQYFSALSSRPPPPSTVTALHPMKQEDLAKESEAKAEKLRSLRDTIADLQRQIGAAEAKAQDVVTARRREKPPQDSSVATEAQAVWLDGPARQPRGKVDGVLAAAHAELRAKKNKRKQRKRKETQPKKKSTKSTHTHARWVDTLADKLKEQRAEMEVLEARLEKSAARAASLQGQAAAAGVNTEIHYVGPAAMSAAVVAAVCVSSASAVSTGTAPRLHSLPSEVLDAMREMPSSGSNFSQVQQFIHRLRDVCRRHRLLLPVRLGATSGVQPPPLQTSHTDGRHVSASPLPRAAVRSMTPQAPPGMRAVLRTRSGLGSRPHDVPRPVSSAAARSRTAMLQHPMSIPTPPR